MLDLISNDCNVLYIYISVLTFFITILVIFIQRVRANKKFGMFDFDDFILFISISILWPISLLFLLCCIIECTRKRFSLILLGQIK